MKTDDRSAARIRELRPAAEAARGLLEELRLMPLGMSQSECYGIVERWLEDGNIRYGRDLAEWIGAEGDETAYKFTELIVLTMNMLPSLLAVLEEAQSKIDTDNRR